MDVLLRGDGLQKVFSDGSVGLRNVSMSLHRGEILGFAGPNGAGKTTTARLLVGAAAPTGGTIEILGQAFSPETISVKRRIGYVASDDGLFEHLTGAEHVLLAAQVYSVPREEARNRGQELFRTLELSWESTKRVRDYSHGMRRKIAIACALAHDPEILVLDEPLEGIDVPTSRILKDIFVLLASRGRGIFLTTHDLSLIEGMCQRVIVIDRGEVLFDGPVDELKRRTSSVDEASLESAFLRLIGREDRKGELSWIRWDEPGTGSKIH